MRSLLVVAAVLAATVASLAAQAPTLWLRGPAGERHAVSVAHHRGYAAVPAGALARAGWRVVEATGDGLVRLDLAGAERLELRPGSPFFRWNGRVRQLTHDPYTMGARLYLPLQLLTDLLPAELGELYAWDLDGRVFSVRSEDVWEEGAALAAAAEDGVEGVGGSGGGADGARRAAARRGEASRPEAPARERADPTRVVVIDPGHGGDDPGAVGSGGVREKDVALALGLAVARELRRFPNLEVYVTREEDVLVPLWQRGERATRWKGERPGIFVSLHANALPSNRSIRGFETYFLAEARNEHARRLAAIENAPVGLPGEAGESRPENPDLTFILRELRNLDHQHWSALLAELIHEELDPVHPGPNRGVKQGPFAVITNALMPAVLVEIGYLTHREEERVLDRQAFRQDAAAALARAIVGFFERYPPERGSSTGSLP